MEHRRMILKWMLPAATLLLAIIFYCFVSGCGFLGIVFGVISVIATLFCLLNMWHKRKPVAAKRLRIALLGVLSLVLIASVITLIPILRGPATAESENGYLIVFDDLYARTLTAGLAELIASRPKNISPYFSFAVSHGAPSKS